MHKPAQIIVTPKGERLAVLPEAVYLMLLAASEDDEGDVLPEFAEELDRQRSAVAEGRGVRFESVLRKGALIPGGSQ